MFSLAGQCLLCPTMPEDQSGPISFTLLLGNREGSKGRKAFSILIISRFAIYFLYSEGENIKEQYGIHILIFFLKRTWVK